MKKIIDIDDEEYKRVSSILEESWLDLDLAIKIFFNKIIQTNSVSWLIDRGIKKCSTASIGTAHMTKSKAISLFCEQGYRLNGYVTFASKNATAYNYWANPCIDVLWSNWNLILNDTINQKLFLFIIKSGTLAEESFSYRPDRQNLIDLQIRYDDPTFTDSRSPDRISFRKFLVKTIDY